MLTILHQSVRVINRRKLVEVVYLWNLIVIVVLGGADRWCSVVQYLAWSLKRSKAVNGCQRVVGVVGKGHLRGVVHALLHDQHNLRFKDLVGDRGSSNGHLPKTQQMRKLAKNLAIETAIGLLLWWAWDSIQHH